MIGDNLCHSSKLSNINQVQSSSYFRPILGLICLEGPDKEVEELWKKIRLLRWQKIRAIEKENLINKTSFETFEELNMDQAKFVQFLKEKDLNHIAIYDFKLD